jgi:hypothetical protein
MWKMRPWQGGAGSGGGWGGGQLQAAFAGWFCAIICGHNFLLGRQGATRRD